MLENESGEEKKEDITINPENDNKTTNPPKTDSQTVNPQKEISKTENLRTINPQTGDNIAIYATTATISFLILIMLFAKRTTQKQHSTSASNKEIHGKHIQKGKRFFGLLIIASLLIPTISRATTGNIKIIFENSFKIYDRLVVTYQIGNEAKEIVVNYNETAPEIEEPEKKGYVFKGWYLSDGTKFNPNEAIKDNETITAKFELINYNITYDLDGGNVSNPTSYTAEDNITLNNPEKVGYTFSGWTGSNGDSLQTRVTINKGNTGDKEYKANYSPNKDTRYTVIHKLMDIEGKTYITKDTEELHGATDTTVKPQTNIYEGFIAPLEKEITINGDGTTTLEYEYNREKYTLQTENTEIENSTPNGKYYYGTKIKLVAEEKEGYIFKQWSNGEKEKEIEFEIKEDTQIEPEYEIIEYNITYDLDEGTATNPTSYTIEDNITLNNPEKEGYVFSGWTGSNGESLQTKVTINKGTTGNKTYKANYSPNENTKYTVIHKTMNLDGANYTKVDTEILQGTTGTKVKPQTKIYEGFTAPEEKEITIKPDGTTVLEYEYTRNQYTLTSENTDSSSTQNGKYYYGTEIKLKAEEKTGYIFEQWSNGNTEQEIKFNLKEDTTIEAQYNLIIYRITYNIDGGTATNPEYYTVEDEITLTNPQKTGYSFSGWTGSNGETLQTRVTINKGTTGDKSYKANYSPNEDTQYIVIHKTMNLDGENYTEQDRETLHGTTGIVVKPQVKEYSGFTSPQEEEITIEPDGTTVLEYKYTRNKYTLTIKNSEYTDSTQTKPAGNYYYGTQIKAVALNRTGYTFTGWDTENTGLELNFVLENNTEIKPNYEANQYQVIFNSNGGNESNNTQTLTYDQTAKLNKSIFTKQGYTFSKWTTKADGTGQSYQDEENVKNLVAEGSITLYAQYAPNTNTKYTVIHKLMNLDGQNYTTKEEDTQELRGTTDAVVTPAVKTYEGFTSPTPGELTIKADGTATKTYLYTRNKYTLTVEDAEYVETTTPSGEYYYGTEIKLKAKDKADNTFKKWSNGATTTEITFNLKANTTIKPEYRPNEFVVTYNANGGYFGTSDVTTNAVTYNQSNSIKNGSYRIPIQTTKGFNGWYTTVECTSGTEFDISTYTEKEDITVYADWTLYKAQFNLRSLYRKINDADSDTGVRIKSIVRAIKRATEVPEWAVGLDWSKPMTKTDEYFPLYGTAADTSSIYQIPILFWYDYGDETIYWYCEDKYPVATYNDQYGKTMGFNDCPLITDISGVQDWDVSQMDFMEGFFSGCKNLTNLTPIKNWDVSNVTSMKTMFKGMTALTDASPINNWNLNINANFSQMFNGTTARPTFTFTINGVKKAGTWATDGTLIVPTE